MEAGLQELVAFHLSGRKPAAGLESIDGLDLRPALLAGYRDLAQLRYDYPLVLVRNASPDRTCVQSLSGIVDDVIHRIAVDEDGDRLTHHVLRLEQRIRAAVTAGAGGSLAALAFINVTDSGPRNIALPFLIHDHLGLQVAALGMVASSFSIGSVTGAVVLGRLKRIRRRGLLLYGSAVVGGLMIVGYGLSPNLVVMLAVAFVYGLTFSAIALVWTNTLQEMVAPDMLGRVSSIDALGSFVLMPVGFALAGWLTDKIGPVQVFILGGSSTVALALLAYLR